MTRKFSRATMTKMPSSASEYLKAKTKRIEVERLGKRPSNFSKNLFFSVIVGVISYVVSRLMGADILPSAMSAAAFGGLLFFLNRRNPP